MSPLAVVIADTHLPRRASALPEGLIPHLERADLILHAVIHDSGPKKGRRNRMRRRFQRARVVVFGQLEIAGADRTLSPSARQKATSIPHAIGR